jgi:hypothetical protein
MYDQMRLMRVCCTRPFTRYDLRNADERIAQVRTYIGRERAKLRGLQADSGEATRVRQVQSGLERTLRHFQEYRNQIADQLKSMELTLV